ncbi:MAG: tetratricopeptide repeat protein, partial [Myxococcota bacterium]
MQLSPTAEELMPKANRSKIIFNWHNALIPISLVIMYVLRFVFHAPLWVLIALCAWIPLVYVVFPLTLRSKWLSFDREFTRRYQKGEYKQLLDYYRKQWLLRRFGPQAEMMGKLGLIYSAMERYRDAEQALERAIDAAHEAHRDQLYFNLANVKFELGKHDAAERIYRTLKPSSPYRHAASTQLALIDVNRGERVDQARRVLERERERA